jgi:hypothetical protein
VSLVSPENRGEFDTALSEKKAANEAEGKAAVGENEAGAGAMAGLAAKEASANANMQGGEAARRKALDAQQADYDRMQSEAATGKIVDPTTQWGLGTKALATIAVAIGEFGRSLTHGRQNAAMDIINESIGRNIQVQRENLAGKQEAAKGAAQGLAQMRARFGDERVADAAEYARQLEGYKLLGDAEVKKAHSPMLQAQYQGLAANIDAEQAKMHSVLTQWQPEKTVQTGGGGPGGPGGAVASDVPTNEVIALPDGRHVTVPKEDREKVLAEVNKANDVHQAIGSVGKLLLTPLTQRGIDWVKAYDAAQKVVAASEIEGGGKGGKGIFEQYQKAAGGRTLTLTPGVADALKQIDAGAMRASENAIRNSAQHEVKPMLVYNAKKNEMERKYQIIREYQRPPDPGTGDQYNKPAGQ